MIKWVVIIVCGWLLFKLISNDSRKKGEKKQQTMERKVATGEMVKDPICGAYVSPEQQIRVRAGDAVHHFCSYECRDKFVEQLENQKQVSQQETFTETPEAEESTKTTD